MAEVLTAEKLELLSLIWPNADEESAMHAFLANGHLADLGGAGE